MTTAAALICGDILATFSKLELAMENNLQLRDQAICFANRLENITKF